MKKLLIILTLISISFISGFSITTRIVDDIFMVMIVGYDYVEEDLITGTAVAPFYKADKTIENLSFSDTSSLIYENRDKLDAKSPRPLLSGKLECALFNRELAEKGIMTYIDNLQRDPNVGSRVNLAIFEGSTEKILKKPIKDQPTGVYFSNLLEQNNQFDNLPITNLHTFGYQFFSEGMDPILPLLEEEKEVDPIGVKIKGIALFKKDKMVATVDKKEFLYFRSLYEHFDNGTLFIKFNKDERAFLATIKSSRKIKVNSNQKEFNPEVKISIKMEGVIREYSGKSITKSNINDFEKQIEKQIEEKTTEMIKKFQEMGIDPIGIGNHVSNFDKNWNKKQWEDIYPNLNVPVTVDFRILEHGIIK